MELRINNKDLMECELYDLETVINNQDYRENQYLDYKESFSFLDVAKDTLNYKELIQQKTVEFRNDICSFANADGGYIVYGISDYQGTADKMIGVNVNDPDKFELNIRNKMSSILPKSPRVMFRFVRMDNGRYIVVLRIEHDFYAPYIHMEDQKNYKIYKRNGNGKQIIEYSELKNMFTQSRVLEDEILSFRKKRIAYYQGLGGEKYQRFMIFHIIPESFLSERKQLFVIEKQKHWNFGDVFSGTRVESQSLPCVDGLRYTSYNGAAEALMYNNGTAEYIFPLTNGISHLKDGLYFAHDYVWRYIDCVAQGYQSMIPELFGNQRYFACISIMGCKSVISEEHDLPQFNTLIDREEIICWPIAFSDMANKESFCDDLKKLHLEYLLSVGIKRKQELSDLINEIEGKQ